MLEALFWDHNGDFQAATAAATVALFGAIISGIFSWLSYRNSVKTAEKQHQMEQKKIDADIISKSRMHWIDNTKDIASEFLINSLRIVTLNAMLVDKFTSIKKWSEVEQKNILIMEDENSNFEDKDIAINFNKKIKKMKADQKESISKINNEINDLMYRASKDYTLLLLNFSKNDENNSIINSIRDINNDLRRVTRELKESENPVGDEVVYWIKIKDKVTHEKSSINKKVEQLTVDLRDYYKKEWEKVKAGE
ncbi:TPA: hypothetical protein QFP75_001209 [Enterococcus faecium]|nr:hypothetical protein [Enterococcus faecium]